MSVNIDFDEKLIIIGELSEERSRQDCAVKCCLFRPFIIVKSNKSGVFPCAAGQYVGSLVDTTSRERFIAFI